MLKEAIKKDFKKIVKDLGFEGVRCFLDYLHFNLESNSVTVKYRISCIYIDPATIGDQIRILEERLGTESPHDLSEFPTFSATLWKLNPEFYEKNPEVNIDSISLQFDDYLI